MCEGRFTMTNPTGCYIITKTIKTKKILIIICNKTNIDMFLHNT